MKYAELTELWKKQREKYKNWQIGLMQNAEKLRIKMEEYLQPPAEKWKEDDKPITHNYIALVDLSKEDRPISGNISRESITNEGELLFGLGITFDHGVNTYPKQLLHIPVAIRFFENNPEYSFFDTETGGIEKPIHWEKNIDQFCETMVSRIVAYLNFDPFNGPKGKSSIGF